MMDYSNDMPFEEWFNHFLDEVKKLNYNGAIDKESFQFEYDNGIPPTTAAKEFMEEMNA